MSDQKNNAAESSNEPSADTLTDESFDGIQQFDHPLPKWWIWLFAGCLVFAPPYFWYYHNGTEGRSLADQHDTRLAENLKLQFSQMGELKADRETLVRFTYEDSWLRVGRSIFKTNCVSCHGRDGIGQVGPNLQDDHYKNVRDIEDILRVLQNGANAGAMPAWKSKLSTNEIVLVSAYVASLRGTSDGSGKPAEGREIPAWPPAPPKDASEEDPAAQG